MAELNEQQKQFAELLQKSIDDNTFAPLWLGALDGKLFATAFVACTAQLKRCTAFRRGGPLHFHGIIHIVDPGI